VVAARQNSHGLPDHRRNAKCVRRAAGKPFGAVRQADEERSRRDGQGVRDVDLIVADPGFRVVKPGKGEFIGRPAIERV